MSIIKPPHAVINRLQAALGLADLKCVSIEFRVAANELCKVNVTYYPDEERGPRRCPAREGPRGRHHHKATRI